MDVSVIQIALIGIIAIMLAIIFKKGKEEYALYITIGACFVILALGISKLEVILDAIDKIQGYIKLNKSYVAILVKIVGITYVTEISSSLCKDSGYQSVGDQIELVGKLSILAISMPILLAILETIDKFLEVS